MKVCFLSSGLDRTLESVKAVEGFLGETVRRIHACFNVAQPPAAPHPPSCLSSRDPSAVHPPPAGVLSLPDRAAPPLHPGLSSPALPHLCSSSKSCRRPAGSLCVSFRPGAVQGSGWSLGGGWRCLPLLLPR